ncbi:hypothetical protein Dimus_027375 [Dionaea muscipula]
MDAEKCTSLRNYSERRDIGLTAPEPYERPDTPRADGKPSCAVHRLSYILGLRFPLCPFYQDVCTELGVSPSQLTPNAWGILCTFALGCNEIGRPLSAKVFLRFYSTQMTEIKSTTYFSLKARKGPGIPLVNPSWRRKKVRWVERDDLSEAEEALMSELVSRRDAGYFWSVQKDPSLAHLQVARIDAPYRSRVRVMAPAAMELDSDLDDDKVSIGSQSPYGDDPASNWTISHEPSEMDSRKKLKFKPKQTWSRRGGYSRRDDRDRYVDDRRVMTAGMMSVGVTTAEMMSVTVAPLAPPQAGGAEGVLMTKPERTPERGGQARPARTFFRKSSLIPRVVVRRLSPSSLLPWTGPGMPPSTPAHLAMLLFPKGVSGVVPPTGSAYCWTLMDMASLPV